MTKNPANYEGVKEKLFWFSMSLYGAGIIAVVSMVWSLSIRSDVQEYKIDRQSILIEKTWEKANENNKILSLKADQSENRSEHLALMEQMKFIIEQQHRLVIKKYSGMIQDTAIIDSMLWNKPLITLNIK